MSEQPDVDGPEPDEVDEIRLSVPALPAYARIARLTVTGLASRLGYSYDEIEDLRIAVGEMCSILLSAPAGRLTFECALAGTRITVEATRDPIEPPPVITDLNRQILLAVVDEADIDPDHARVRVVKRLRA